MRPGEELDWPSLERYLRSEIDGLDGPMEVLQFPNGSANLTYFVRFGDRRFVVRRPPFGQIAPGAHDMKREYRTLSRLWRAYDPAPRAFAFCDDHSVIGSDFLVIDYRPGVVVWGVDPAVDGATPRRRPAASASPSSTRSPTCTSSTRTPSSLADLGRPDGFVERQVGGLEEAVGPRRPPRLAAGDAGGRATDSPRPCRRRGTCRSSTTTTSSTTASSTRRTPTG